MRMIFRYIILSAIRDKLFLALFLSLLSAFVFSNLVGFSSLSEENLMQVIIFSGTSKILLVFGMIIFVSFHISKSFENKEIQFILSKNISREKFILSYWLSFNFISFILLLFFLVLLSLFCSFNFLGTLQWIISVELELMVITTFSIISVLILQSAIFSIFLSSGFFIVSKLMGFFLNSFTPTFNDGFLSFLVMLSNYLLKFVSSLIPRLDIFSQTKWIIYGPDFFILKIIIIQSVVYTLIIFLMAFYDFKKKQF